MPLTPTCMPSKSTCTHTPSNPRPKRRRGLSLAGHLLGKHLLPTAISPSLTLFDLDVPQDHVLAHDAHAFDTHVPSRLTLAPLISTFMRTLDTLGQAGRVTHWMPRLCHPLPRLKRETEGVLLILSCQCPLSPLASNACWKGLSRSRQHLCRVCPRLCLHPAHTHKVCDGYHSHLQTISALTALVSHTRVPCPRRSCPHPQLPCPAREFLSKTLTLTLMPSTPTPTMRT